MSFTKSTHDLNGKILFQNADVETSVIIKNEDTEDTYQYTFEKPTKWTPYNSNLHMHAMKVGDGSYCTGIELSQSSLLAFAVEYYVSISSFIFPS